MNEDDIFRRTEPVGVNPGEVYYSRKYNRFFQVREVHDDSLLCSNLETYHRDATTTIKTQRVSWNFLKDCLRVSTLDEHPEFWEHDGTGWRAKEE